MAKTVQWTRENTETIIHIVNSLAERLGKAQQGLEWILNDMKYCAPEMAAEKMAIWYSRVEGILDDVGRAKE